MEDCCLPGEDVWAFGHPFARLGTSLGDWDSFPPPVSLLACGVPLRRSSLPTSDLLRCCKGEVDRRGVPRRWVFWVAGVIGGGSALLWFRVSRLGFPQTWTSDLYSAYLLTEIGLSPASWLASSLGGCNSAEKEVGGSQIQVFGGAAIGASSLCKRPAALLAFFLWRRL